MTYSERLNQARQIAIAKARRHPWFLGQLLIPEFFNEEKWYLREILQELAFGTQNLAISLPPRHGKSLSLMIYEAWRLGVNPKFRFIKGSYNDDSAMKMSKATRDLISAERSTETEIIYHDVFPERVIKSGDGGASMWSVEGGAFNYTATGRGGTVTGNGADDLIVDDPIKDANEAYNQRTLDEAWLWFSGTLMSRLEANARVILNATRWSDLDIIGRATKIEAMNFKVIEYQAYDEATGKMLAPSILPYEDYARKKAVMTESAKAIFYANYHNVLLRLKGALYAEFKTYVEMPEGVEERISYTDFADTGADFLCSIYGNILGGYCYITNVVYTDGGVAETKPLVVESLKAQKTERANIESQNGGQAFADAVQEEVPGCWINAFHQSKNKIARIISNAEEVNKKILFPHNWADIWPDFYLAITTYMRVGKNAHDDAPDALTGIVEMMSEGVVFG